MYTRTKIFDKCELNETIIDVSFSCDRVLDPVTGLLSIHMSWSYEYNRLIEEAITKRNLFFTSAMKGGNTIPANNNELSPPVN